MRDPYDVLELTRKADADAVKAAFRKLAKKHHPDRNKDDPKAKDRFAEISAANEILSDQDKRARFDRGEIDAAGQPRGPSFEDLAARGRGRGGGAAGFEFRGGAGGPFGAGGFDAGSIFAEMFAGGPRGRGPAPKGADVEASLDVTLEEVASGAEKRLRLPSGREVTVTIPASGEDGKRLRLRGLGDPSPLGGEPGDLMLQLRILPHAGFEADGRDLRSRVPLPLDTAVLGGKLRVPTLAGEVEVSVAPGTSSGRTLRLRGKGLPRPGGGAGDLFARLEIALPDPLDPELVELMRRRAEAPV